MHHQLTVLEPNPIGDIPAAAVHRESSSSLARHPRASRQMTCNERAATTRKSYLCD